MKPAFPGKLLGSCIDFQASDGTYVYLGKIYANMKGFIRYENGPSDQ